MINIFVHIEIDIRNKIEVTCCNNNCKLNLTQHCLSVEEDMYHTSVIPIPRILGICQNPEVSILETGVQQQIKGEL